MPNDDPASTLEKCSTVPECDPLLDLIQAYRAGLVDFRENAPEDDDGANAYADETYCPPMIALESWKAPAKTRASALSALTLAKEAHCAGDGSLVGPMISAALSYFEAPQ